MKITREALVDGSLTEFQRRHAAIHPDMRWRSEAEMAELLDAILSAHDTAEDLWVFGYGSLIWNPAFNHAERACALLRGWHRRFCLKIYVGRGTPRTPGLMLALDQGGACRGVAFRIAAAQVREELGLLWQREMFGGAYNARWVTLESCAEAASVVKGGKFRALTFVINPAHPRYTRAFSVAETAVLIASGCGELGTCREYLENTVAHLRELGVRDSNLARIMAALPP
ncbi:gamma-glutamylcyclotransferase [Acidocella sp.]|uniref:gamma-glutamylcyclotransferase n=1 Tax=Acidocella sp. TaxID=50710 RepID=UPI002618DA6C|nr:gamma-glutamylcyclotransferase [Acidocella sp.]